MRTQPILAARLLAIPALSFLASAACFAQVPSARVRITQPVDETKLTVLHGNTHPLARPQFDRGATPYSLPMQRMQLVLKRSAERETALETLMAQQQDKSSPNYHRWLTPDQFGSEFGPSDQDIQTVTSWLQSHGFQVNNVSKGRMLIEFSGDAAQVQEAFHTPIHSFVVNGVHHWANVNDPAIPTALTPVVAGLSSLHNFFPRRMSRSIRPRAASALGSTRGLAMPQFTFTDTQNNTSFALGPADFATIYNVLPLWNSGIDGTGETIAVVTDSNINIQDIRDFRSVFGLPAKDPKITVNGADPGIDVNGDEIEALLDVEWAGAVARNANINLVVSQSTNTTFGGDLSANFIISENPPPPILSESFGACELDIGTAQNAMYNSMWQQAAAEGITVLVSTGDNGSASCDVTQINGFPAGPAQFGLEVNGIASTPFNVAVGGTDFDDFSNANTFWNSTNTSGTQASAKSYIPETTWNDTCTNVVVYATVFGFANPTTFCNNVQATQNQFGVDFTLPVGASGGASNCTVSDGVNQSSCTGGYPKPSYQVGVTPVGDLTRDLPDVSLFAGDGLISGSFYVICERDQQGPNANTSAACNLSTGAFVGVGGTSVSTQAFAGIMALVDQKAEGAQGNANEVLYPLFAAQSASCNTNGPPAATCIFNDVTSGTIAMPCVNGSPNCTSGGNPVGVLAGFDAGAGYDAATGLGSVNAANLVNAPSAWTSSTGGADFSLSVSPSAVTVARGATGTVTLTVTANGGFVGTVTPACSDLPSGVTCSGSTVMGSGSSTITFTASSSAMLAPANRPTSFAGLSGTSRTAVPLALCALCAILLLSHRQGKRKSSAVFAAVALGLLFVAGCSGSSNNNGGGGPTGTSNVVITATSGSIQRSVAVTLTID
ncbi:MAG TPA: S53 family peptidase [Candidatus Acidoferrales bacterium]